MKVYQKIQQGINEITDGFEMAGYLDAIYVVAQMFCMRHYPEEIYKTDSGEIRMSITGFGKYLNSRWK